MRRMIRAVSCTIVALGLVVAATPSYAETPKVDPVASALSAQWWNWAAAEKASDSPLSDKAGVRCRVDQQGITFNLAGSSDGSAVNRTCSLPSGKLILLPVINGECSRVEHDGNTTAKLTNCAAKQLTGATYRASLDSRPLKVTRLRSGPYELRYVAGNVFGIGGDHSGRTTSVADGYWVFLRLRPGHYVVHSVGSVPGFTQTVTYHLDVQR